MNRRQLMGFAVGPIGAGALAAVTLPILTWIFPQQEIGMLAMLKVAISFSTLLFCLGLDQAYVREYHEYDHKPRLLLMALAPGLVLLLVVGVAICLLAPTWVSNLLFAVPSILFGWIVLACLVVSLVSRFLSLILRMEDRGLAYSMSQLLPRTLLLLIALSYLWLTPSRHFVLLLLAQTAALVATLAVFAWNTRASWLPALRASIDRKAMRGMMAFGTPLIFAGVAAWGLRAIDRLFLRSMSTYEELAVFSVAASIAGGATILASVFNIVWAPMVYRWIADGEDLGRVDDVANIMAALVFMLACLVGAFSWVLAFLLPVDYARVQYLVVGCMLMPLLYTLAEVTGIGIQVSRKTIYSVAVTLAAVIVDIVLCYLLVPRMGATGATIAMASAFWIFFVLRTEVSARLWRDSSRWRSHAVAGTVLASSLAFALWGNRAVPLGPLCWCLLFMIGGLAQKSQLTAAYRYVRSG